MKAKMFAVALAFTGFVSSSAQAGSFFIGGGINNNSYEYADVGNSTGNQLYLGYYFDQGLFLEAARVDLGEGDIEGTSWALHVNGSVVSIGYKWEAPEGLGFYGKIGSYSFDSEVSGAGLKGDSNGVAFGGGLVYAFNQHFALRAGIESYSGVEDFANKESVTGGALSLEARF